MVVTAVSSLFLSLSHLALIIDDVPAAHSLPSPSIRFSSSYSLMNDRFSILFLPLSLHVSLPRNRPGDRSRLPVLASLIGRSSVEGAREAPLPPTGTRDPRRPRDRPHHVARLSRCSIYVDHHQGNAARAKLRGLLSPFPVSVHLPYNTLVMVARISLLR